MASGIMVSLQEEVTCPICLELLTEPLSLDCGHSFCQACITANNMVSVNDPDEDRRCPVCRISYEPGNLRPNRHVANIVQRLREVKLSPEVEQERNLCLRHGEKLMLFCEEDREVICWLCERSQEHHGHHTFLMEEVAQDYQKKLQEALEKLREKQLEAEELEVKVRADVAAWKCSTLAEGGGRESRVMQEGTSILDSYAKIESQPGFPFGCELSSTMQTWDYYFEM
ncbi:hypothetical protein MJT46_010147 [Ovis ammon polii x Ovis aries]|nr:hypothetical protein MJT46_010147 [Ovis ammon polii x Ovis aries]